MSRQQNRTTVELTADQEAEAERIYALIKGKVDEQVREMARLSVPSRQRAHSSNSFRVDRSRSKQRIETKGTGPNGVKIQRPA